MYLEKVVLGHIGRGFMLEEEVWRKGPWRRQIAKTWEELQIEMGELPETRPQEGSNNSTRREHSRSSCQVGKQTHLSLKKLICGMAPFWDLDDIGNFSIASATNKAGLYN
ncbi:hypothetical protein RJT34_24218 [Clitoria ternatea]|uniref:Uncharacterized protein n=1 Tax=Clitoria ternatea TaxID=43366 RepID=A0AAN9IHA1_CLITE